MTAPRLILGVLLATLALAATACGSGSPSVSEGAVANVNGTDIKKAELDRYMQLAKRSSERQQQEFPKAGTPEYQSFQQSAVALLVELALFRQAAKDLEVQVTDKDIDKLEKGTIDQYFGGDRGKYEKALKEYGFTREEYRENQYAVSVLRTKLFEAVTKDVDVT